MGIDLIKLHHYANLVSKKKREMKLPSLTKLTFDLTIIIRMQLIVGDLVGSQGGFLEKPKRPANPCPKEGTSHQQEYKAIVIGYQELNAYLT